MAWFGKRPSNSASAAPHGGGDDTYRQQPPHIRRLIDAMQVIFDDASKLADAIRQGKSLPSSTPAEPHVSPIRCAQSEALFEHVNDKGVTLYSCYHFTTDFKTMNPAAQYFLHVMYGRIYMANMLADRLSHGPLADGELAALKACVDEILAKSAYYSNYFRAYAFSAAILMNRLSKEELKQSVNAQGEDWARRLNAAKAAMFQPERLIEFVPDREFKAVLAAETPYQEGQAVINGVYFPPEHAKPMLERMAAAQAEAVGPRQRMLAELTPTGTLRVAIDFGNPALARKVEGGAPAGIVPDLAVELARRLGAPVKFVAFEGTAKIAAAATANQWDIAFLAVDPAGAPEIAFSPPYAIIGGSIPQAIGTLKGRFDGTAFVRDFVEDVKASGFVAAAITRAGQSASVAPPVGKG
jgi:Bacterial extracellular solute-binding proteins, family 3